MKCENCKYYVALELADFAVGECFRNPPVEGVATAKGRRPIVQPTKDWCGEFKPIEPVLGLLKIPPAGIEPEPKQVVTHNGLYVSVDLNDAGDATIYHVRQVLDNGGSLVVHVGYFETEKEAENYMFKYSAMSFEEKKKAIAGLA